MTQRRKAFLAGGVASLAVLALGFSVPAVAADAGRAEVDVAAPAASGVPVAAAASAAAPAATYAMIGAEQVRVATTLSIMEESDRDRMNRYARRLMREVRRTPEALDYRTIAEIPDARTVGYGDCKSFSVAYRNFLRSMGYHPDSLLLSVVDLPNGDPHMVLLIRVKDYVNGLSEKTLVYDPNRPVILPIQALMRDGYRFRAREVAPGGPLVNFDGRQIS